LDSIFYEEIENGTIAKMSHHNRFKTWAVHRYVTHFGSPMIVTIYGKDADEARLKTKSQCGGWVGEMAEWIA
jgi:hypothetical protein